MIGNVTILAKTLLTVSRKCETVLTVTVYIPFHEVLPTDALGLNHSLVLAAEARLTVFGFRKAVPSFAQTCIALKGEVFPAKTALRRKRAILRARANGIDVGEVLRAR